MEQAREQCFVRVQSETLTGLRGYRLLIWSSKTFLVAASPLDGAASGDEDTVGGEQMKKKSHFCKSKWTVTDEALRFWMP